jgi:hypothetical protein
MPTSASSKTTSSDSDANADRSPGFSRISLTPHERNFDVPNSVAERSGKSENCHVTPSRSASQQTQVPGGLETSTLPVTPPAVSDLLGASETSQRDGKVRSEEDGEQRGQGR